MWVALLTRVKNQDKNFWGIYSDQVINKGYTFERRISNNGVGGLGIWDFLQGKELLRAERLVMDLGRSLNKVLEVGSCEWNTEVSDSDSLKSNNNKPGQEVPQVVELSVPLVLHVDHTPPILPAPNRLTIDNDVTFRPNDSKGNHRLKENKRRHSNNVRWETHPDLLVELSFLFVILVSVEGVQTDVVVHKFSTNLLVRKLANLVPSARIAYHIPSVWKPPSPPRSKSRIWQWQGQRWQLRWASSSQ